MAYVAQRILAAKDERHGLARDALVSDRPLRLAALALDSGGLCGGDPLSRAAKPEEGYVRVMVDVLPSPDQGTVCSRPLPRPT